MERKFFLALAVAVAVVSPLRADETETENGPGRGVARISLLNGDVSIRRGDSGDLVAAALNSPLVVQDRVLTGPGSRTEIQFDWASFLRLFSNAEVRLAELEYRRYLIQLARGTVTFRVLRDLDADIEISTPTVAVRPVKQGTYRVSVHEDGSSEITVRSGEAEIFTPRGSERLRSGRTMMARGTAADPQFRVGSEIPKDEWDRWNERRDQDLERSRSYNYISRDIYGAEDLDDHGHWVYVAPYGYVWSPRVAVGWAPYRYGRWSWIDWYGWSWVSYDPWGWAPYHYGRWFYNAPYGWCWYPGAIHARHYWSPALVGFFGFGGGVSIGIGFGWGHVGWVPLAPYERFHRWWGPRYYGGYRNRTYINNSVTVVNNVNVTNIYRNARINNGITAIDQDGFSRGRAGRSIRLNEGDFQRASLVQGQLPVVPQRESLRLSDRTATGVTESRTERFFSRRAVPQVDKVPFDDQRRGVELAARRTFGDDGSSRVVTAEEPRRPAGGAGSDSVRGNRSAFTDTSNARTSTEERRGWRRADEPVRGAERSTEPVQRSLDRGETNNEWRRFGSPRTEAAGADNDRRPAGRFGEPATAPAAERSRDSEWRRFSERSNSERSNRVDTGTERGSRGSLETQPSVSERRSERGDSLRRDMTPRTEIQRSYEAPSRGYRGERQSTEPRSESNAPVRISPPIVRERGDRSNFSEGPRSTPRMEGGGAMRGGDGGSRGSRMSGGDAAPSGGRGGNSGRGGEGRGGRSGR
jgi:hypothetical protein